MHRCSLCIGAWKLSGGSPGHVVASNLSSSSSGDTRAFLFSTARPPENLAPTTKGEALWCVSAISDAVSNCLDLAGRLGAEMATAAEMLMSLKAKSEASEVWCEAEAE